MRRLAAALAAAPLLAACSATVRTASLTRVEHMQSMVAATASTVRLAPVISVRTDGHADAPSLELTPQVTRGGTATTRVTAQARWSARGLLHPGISASIEDGSSRSTELAGDTIGPVPAVPVLRARMMRAALSAHIDQGRRAQLSARIDLSNSAGLGASASSLPHLSTAALELRHRYDVSRRVRLDASLRTSSEQTGDAPTLATTRAQGGLQWTLPAYGSLALSLGALAASSGGASPLAELGITAGRTDHGPRLSAVLGRTAEVDRLDGVLRDRSRTRVRLETPLVPRVSFGGSLQIASDIGGTTQRVVRSADATLTIDAGRAQRIEIGVARFQQYSGGITTNAERRAFLQFTLAPSR